MPMKKILIFLPLIISTQGCLVFHSVSYEVKLDNEKSGNVVVMVNDIRSDAVNTSELEEDKNQLFNFLLKSDDFIQQMKEEGKMITDRRLFNSEGKLKGNINYTFNDISDVEGIVYEETFYFLTLGVDDSVISTNGELIKSKNYKRIMWDSSLTVLKFEMFSADVSSGNLVELTKYLEED